MELDQRINLDEMYTIEDFEQITEEQRHSIMTEALRRHHNLYMFTMNDRLKKAIDVVRSSHPFDKLNDVEKAFVVQELTFLVDDERVVRALIDNGITLKVVEQMNNYLKYIKQRRQKENTLVNPSWQKNVMTISSRMCKHFGCPVPSVIFNKINHVTSKNRELFMELEQEEKSFQGKTR